MSAYVHWHNSLSFKTLGHRLRSMPMFVALIPFVAGIVVEEYYALPLWCTLTALAISAIMLWIAIPRRVAWLYAILTLLMGGYTAGILSHTTPDTPTEQPLDLIITVESTPAVREGYRAAEGRIEAWHAASRWHAADDRVQLWIRSDSVALGSRLLVRSTLHERISRYEAYNDLMHHRGYAGGVSVADYNILALNYTECKGLHNYSLNKLSSTISHSTAHATVLAMVVGVRHNMPSQLREAYSTTGLAHILAVSGLHLGIVAMFFGTLLLPLNLIHGGHRWRYLLLAACTWLFAVVSGASPSVIRAAVMFTVLMFTLFLSERHNAINSISATILLMLIYDANYLYDISFQLSVVAVFGIIAWATPLIGHLNVARYPLTLRWLISSIIVGIMATLWTLPLVSHNFAQLPIIGIIVTPLVLITAYPIVGLGVCALLLPNPVASWLIVAAERVAALQNAIVEGAATLSYASIEYRMSYGEMAACYTLYMTITAVVWMVERKKSVTLYEYDDYRDLDNTSKL